MSTVFRIRDLVMAGLVFIGLLALVHLALAGDESGMNMGQDHLHHHHDDVFARAPEKARLRPNPLETDPDATAAGKKLFGQHCAECHGEQAEGSHRAPKLRAEEVQNATPGAIFWVLSNGVVRHGMPVWSKLPEPQRWQITTYLKSLQVRADSNQTNMPDRAASEAMKP
jgi:mono/diheme cytochrome c family protein